jgi:hypothetical protein
MVTKVTFPLDDAERQRQLTVLRDLVPSIPTRPLREVEKEIADIRSRPGAPAAAELPLI